MASDGGLEGLQKRLRVFHASYEAGQKSDGVKRRAMRQSLGAVIDFLMAQPNWCAADSALLVTFAEALADVERGLDPGQRTRAQCTISAPLMSEMGHFPALPHRNSNSWFTQLADIPGIEMPCL